jgi:hypothetical protein
MAADDRIRLDADSAGTGAKGEPPAASEPVHIGEELRDLESGDRSKAVFVVGIVLVGIAVVIGIFAYLLRPQARAAGTLESAYAVALPGDNVLVTIKVRFQNVGGKPLWIRNLKGKLVTTDGKEYLDEAANAVDFERYFQGYPDLREASLQPLKVETMLRPGEQIRGSVILGFPVTLDAFNSRKSLAVIVEPYDQAAVTLVK